MERFDWTTYTGPAILKISSHFNIGSFQKISTHQKRSTTAWKFLLSGARSEKFTSGNKMHQERGWGLISNFLHWEGVDIFWNDSLY